MSCTLIILLGFRQLQEDDHHCTGLSTRILDETAFPSHMTSSSVPTNEPFASQNDPQRRLCTSPETHSHVHAQLFVHVHFFYTNTFALLAVCTHSMHTLHTATHV